MQDAGFLGTAAPRAADITLLLEMGMGAGLLAGALLARAGRIWFHAACQFDHRAPQSNPDHLDDVSGFSPSGTSETPRQDWKALLRAGDNARGPWRGC